MIKYIVPFFCVAFLSCSTTEKEPLTYFGGKIINPKSDYVTLHNHNEEVIDSIKLNPDHTFSSSFKDFKSGLYFFRHGAEFQYVFLEPKDSLLLRLNTWDFDESLVFSGTNALKNNILIETFLDNEKQNKDFYSYYDLPAKAFKFKVDSLTAVKNSKINQLQLENEGISEQYISILKTALHYPLYSKLETFRIKNSLKEKPEALDSTFIAHRDNTNINYDSLMFFSPYRDYVQKNLYCDVYVKQIKDDTDDFTIELLNTINAKIKSEPTKNKLLKKSIIRHFYNKSSCKINDEVFKSFSNYSSNKADVNEIARLLDDVKKIRKNKSLPNFKLYTPQGSLENIKDIIKGNSAVIYFRNRNYSSYSWFTSRMNYLINNNPDIQFLVINMQHDNNQFVNGLPIKHQFYLHEKSSAHEFLSSKFPRMILVDKNGKVVNGFCSLSSKKIEKQITEL